MRLRSSAWHSRKADDRERQDDVVEHHRLAAQVPQIVLRVLRDRQEEAGRAADEAQVVEADAGELGERDGQDREIDAGDAEAERQESDDRAARHRDRDRGQQADPRTDAVMHVERGGRIGAEPDIDRVAERQLPGKAHHDVPGLPRIGEIENEDQDGQQVVVGEERRGDQREQQRGNADPAARAARLRCSRAIMRRAFPGCPAGGTAAPAPGSRTRTCSSPTA